jgi:hypothetical protein
MTSAPSQSSRELTTAYLTDLVTNTLDPGYAAAVSGHPISRTDGPEGGTPATASGRMISRSPSLAWIPQPGGSAAARVHADLVNRVRAARSGQQSGRNRGGPSPARPPVADAALPSGGAVRRSSIETSCLRASLRSPGRAWLSGWPIRRGPLPLP